MTGYPRPGAAFGSADIAWQDDAACKGRNPALFFAPEVESVTGRKRREAKAKAICSGCIVRTACLDWRLDSPDQGDGGIWGMADELERTRLRNNRLRTAARRAS